MPANMRASGVTGSSAMTRKLGKNKQNTEQFSFRCRKSGEVQN